jgi:small GTP-binding protein
MLPVVKAVLVGDSGVGKTSIYQRLQHNVFNVSPMSTVGGTFARIRIPGDWDGQEIGLWDTAGQERFRTLVPLYFQRASLVLIVFSIDSHQSYNNIQTWHELAKAQAPPGVHYFLIGSKSDLREGREVPFDDAQKKADGLMADVYIEVSAVTGAGCEDLMAAFGRFLGQLVVEPSELPVAKRADDRKIDSGPDQARSAKSGCC